MGGLVSHACIVFHFGQENCLHKISLLFLVTETQLWIPKITMHIGKFRFVVYFFQYLLVNFTLLCIYK